METGEERDTHQDIRQCPVQAAPDFAFTKLRSFQHLKYATEQAHGESEASNEDPKSKDRRFELKLQPRWTLQPLTKKRSIKQVSKLQERLIRQVSVRSQK